MLLASKKKIYIYIYNTYIYIYYNIYIYILYIICYILYVIYIYIVYVYTCLQYAEKRLSDRSFETLGDVMTVQDIEVVGGFFFLSNKKSWTFRWITRQSRYSFCSKVCSDSDLIFIFLKWLVICGLSQKERALRFMIFRSFQNEALFLIKQIPSRERSHIPP